MKKYFLFACVAAALVSCSSDEFLGETTLNSRPADGSIMFTSANMKASRATVGKEAADILGGNFIVEGFKGSEGTNVASDDVVFDNYLVVWGQNTAGTTEDNTNDWAYVGIDHSDHMTAAILNGSDFGRTVKTQSIKYWDYSTDRYDFVAYSTGTLNMIATGDPEAGISVKVTKINDEWRTTSPDAPAVAYSFTAANANDFAKCYFTDVTPVKKADDAYNKPVQLTFKQLGAKVRVGLYEIVPGYSVKDVQFYADNTVATPATYTAFSGTLPGDQSALTTQNGTKQLFKKVGTDTYETYATYDGTLTLADLYTEATPAVADPTAGDNATLFLSSGTFAEAGTIRVSYPLLGTENVGKDGYLKADVSVVPTAAAGDPSTKTFGELTDNYTGSEGAEASGKYLGRTLAGATMAGASADNYFKNVIPASTGAALTLRVNYTLVSTDGSGEEIKVWGAKAVVPANFCEWQPNYAYTYIFKISDNTNGSTAGLGDTEGLFPITFDAVVADITDASEEQTTVTTVATPSVTTYQKDHAQGAEYAAGDIYVEVMKDGALVDDLNGTNKCYLYTTTNHEATEADVIDALQMNVAASGVTGRNGLVLTDASSALTTTVTTIPAVDGTNITVTEGQAAKITAATNTNYVFVYDFTETATPSDIYSYEEAASTAEPGDWATVYTDYYTKNSDGTYTAAPSTWVAGVYYKKYTNNGRSYAVKVIKTGTAYVNPAPTPSNRR